MRKTLRPSAELSKTELELWLAWQRAGDAVSSRVARDLAEATGLSRADYGVLSQLIELGHGKLRQQDLANSLAWHKSRLSHHLSRMEQRGLVSRKIAPINAVLVTITAAGRRALHRARQAHASSVRKHLLAKVPRQELAQWLSLLARLGQT